MKTLVRLLIVEKISAKLQSQKIFWVLGTQGPGTLAPLAFYVPRMHQKKFWSNRTKLTFSDYLVQYLIEIGLAQGLPEGLET